MNKNLAVNAVAYFSFCALAGTGLLLEFRLCEETSGTIFGLTAEDWRDIHEWASYVFVAVVMLHLVLHWAWIRRLATAHFWTTTVGIAAGVCVVGLLLLTPVQHGGKSHQACDCEGPHEHDD